MAWEAEGFLCQENDVAFPDIVLKVTWIPCVQIRVKNTQKFSGWTTTLHKAISGHTRDLVLDSPH